MEPPGFGGMKFCMNSHAHITDIAFMAIYGRKKNKGNKHLQNQKPLDLENLYKELNANLFKD